MVFAPGLPTRSPWASLLVGRRRAALLRAPGQGELSLAIRWDDDALQLSLVPSAGGPVERERTVELFAQGARWATAPDLRARVEPESSEPRQLEHFMRRLVRGVYAA